MAHIIPNMNQNIMLIDVFEDGTAIDVPVIGWAVSSEDADVSEEGPNVLFASPVVALATLGGDWLLYDKASDKAWSPFEGWWDSRARAIASLRGEFARRKASHTREETQ